jgi:RNA polymerase sigma-70 factor (ECF subfamily)
MEHEESFSALTDQYLKPVYSFVFRLCGNQDDAFDITQEVFLKAWKKRNTYDPKYSYKTWLFTIARNTTIDWLRKKKHIAFSKLESDEGASYSESIPDPEPLPHEIFERKETKEKVEKALEQISPDYKAVVLLHYLDGMTFEEIGKVVGKSVNTVKSQYRRALLALRKHVV